MYELGCIHERDTMLPLNKITHSNFFATNNLDHYQQIRAECTGNTVYTFTKLHDDQEHDREYVVFQLSVASLIFPPSFHLLCMMTVLMNIVLKEKKEE